MKQIALTLIMSLAAPAFAVDFHGLNQKDDCFAAVVALSKGIAESYKVYSKKPAKILAVELSSATEVRDYRVDVDYQGSIDSYRIELSNDSAFKCLMSKVEPTQIGG